MAIKELESEESGFLLIGKILLWLAIGIFFCVFTFPKGLTKLGSAIGWSWVQNIGTTAKAILASLFGASPIAQMASFNFLWSAVVIALSVYVVSLALLSIRHGRFDLIGLGLVFLLCGAAILHLLAWFFYIAFIVLGWVFQILSFILGKLGEFFGFIFGKLGEFLSFLFGGLFTFVSRNPLWLLALLPIFVGIYFAVRKNEALRTFILWVLGIIGAFVGLYLLGKLFQFLAPFLAPIFAFIGHILGIVFHFLFYIIFIGFCVCCIICGFGRLLIDQFTSAWKAGNERRGVILGSLSIGISIAFVLLESNLGNLVRLYPADLPNIIANNLYHGNLPIFDTIIALLVVSVSIVGVLRNLPYLRREPELDEFQSAIIFISPLALLLGILAIVVSGHTES